MEDYIFSHASQGYWVVFSLLILGGFQLPIPEDIVVLAGGYLAAQFQSEMYTTKMLIAIYAGAFIGDCIVFLIGRHFGPSLLDHPFFSRLISPEKKEDLARYFQKYGAWTIFFGRFVPFGVRSGVILSAGLGRTSFVRFALSDLAAICCTSLFLFWLSYEYADKLSMIVYYLRRSYLLILLLLALAVFFMKRFKKTALA